MNTTTITITDLADVQPGDMVTAEYVPHSGEGAATISGIAYKGGFSALWLAGMALRHRGGAYSGFLRFVSATREVPAWEPDAAYVHYLAQALAAPMPETALTDWQAHATRLLGWLKDSPADPVPVDPALDETDKRDRIDSDGDMWRWSEGDAVWRLNTNSVIGNLAALDRRYGPLRFADEEAES